MKQKRGIQSRIPHFTNIVIDMTEKRFMYYEHKGADYILDNPNTELDFIEMLGDCLEAEEIVDLLNNQDDEIKELQERNDRQAKRLDNLYQLILNRDYTGQEELIKELEESERLLQEEMRCVLPCSSCKYYRASDNYCYERKCRIYD